MNNYRAGLAAFYQSLMDALEGSGSVPYRIIAVLKVHSHKLDIKKATADFINAVSKAMEEHQEKENMLWQQHLSFLTSLREIAELLNL